MPPSLVREDGGLGFVVVVVGIFVVCLFGGFCFFFPFLSAKRDMRSQDLVFVKLFWGLPCTGPPLLRFPIQTGLLPSGVDEPRAHLPYREGQGV